MKTYPAKSWESPKLTTKKSLVQGRGVFAIAPILKGEVLVRWGGTVYTTKQVLSGETNEDTACQIDDDLYIADPAGTELLGTDLMNHSCDPNVWMDDEVTISARRDIKTNEEIVADYAMWVAHPGYVIIADCRCGSPLCRHRITGDDWKLPELKARYKDHFPPYLERRLS
jgi:uncharacterized protein